MRARAILSVFAVVLSAGCPNDDTKPGPSATVTASVAPPLPETAASIAPPPPEPERLCPKEMVRVKGTLCVDRYEASMVEEGSGTPITPYYPPNRARARLFEATWIKNKGSGNELEQSMELPILPAWEKQRDFVPKAESRKGSVPQAYATGEDAQRACTAAGKRLCTLDEWRTACRGEAGFDFPYGEKYAQGKCNIFGPAHPGILLYDTPTINHTDPRFNLVKHKGKPLLNRTGAMETCKSTWEDDAIYDMVGNVDEWIDDPEGTFVGGFYARAKKDGCMSIVTAHGFDYADYSTGVRCCKNAEPAPVR